MKKPTRERVLQSAIKLIAAQGSAGTSIAAVAADAGLSPAGVMYHFPTKVDLLLAVQDKRDRLDSARFELPAGGEGGLEVLDRLAELAAFNAAIPGLVQAFTVLDGEAVADDSPQHPWFVDRYRRIVDDLAEGLRDGQVSGEIRADVDCTAIAAEALATMDGLQLQWLLDPERVDLASAYRRYIERLRRSIATNITNK